MPSPTTAYELIKGAMRLAGITTAGETPTADESNDALTCLNDLLESMSTDNLFVWGAADETFSTVAAQSVYTIGTAGNFNTTRPVRIDNAYCIVNGLSYPIQIIGETEYGDIALKTQTDQIIERLLYQNDFPLGRITLWPVPSAVVSLVLSTDRVLTQIATLATAINYPPGYLLFMRHALAMLIAPEYGKVCGEDITGPARMMRASLKRANKQKNLARFDSALCDVGPVTWQRGV